MPVSTSSRVRWLLRSAVVFAPWVLSLFLLYWLETAGIWTLETPHRGKTSVAILVIGMGLSFLLKSRIDSRR